MTGVLIKKRNLDTETHLGKTPWEYGSRDWSDASTSQGKPKISTKPPEAKREGGDRFSLTSSEGTNPAHIFMMDFWPPEL